MFYNQYSYNLNFRGPVNTFYEHINGGGSSFTMNSGEFKEVLEDWWNDRISSVRCPPRSLVALYEDRGFKGRVILLITRGNNSRVVNLHTHLDFNDQLSSIRTFQIC